MTANPCLRCGSDAGDDAPQPSRCGDCPPQPCPHCGEPDNAPCRCCVAVADLSLADLKGIFAMSDLSLDPTPGCCGPSSGCSEPNCTGTPAADAPTSEPVDDCTPTEFARSSAGRGDVATGTQPIAPIVGIRPDCPTCTWPNRETVDMACPTCGFDYGTTTSCEHEWVDRPESDSRECLICGSEVLGE